MKPSDVIRRKALDKSNNFYTNATIPGKYSAYPQLDFIVEAMLEYLDDMFPESNKPIANKPGIIQIDNLGKDASQ